MKEKCSGIPQKLLGRWNKMKISLIDLAFLSEKRKDVLLLLEEGPKTGDEIKTAST